MTIPQTSSNLAREQKRIDRLFLCFSAAYGHVWLRIYKSGDFLDYSKKAWLKELNKFDDKALQYAIGVCIQNHHLPPTLPQFIDCCREYSKRYDFFKKEEESLKSDKATADFHLQQIKAILTKGAKL